MKLAILLPSPMKEKGLAQLTDDYLKRSRTTFGTTLISVKGEKIHARENPSRALEKEAGRLLQSTPAGFVSVALCPDGQELTSEKFTQLLSTWRDQGKRGVAFWIGSAYGLSPDLVRRADARWSLSPMTMPHQLAVTVLAEQIYRAHGILTGSPYHK